MLTTTDDAQDTNVKRFLRLIEYNYYKFEGSLYVRKQFVPLELVEPLNHQLEPAPPPFNNDNISPYKSPYLHFDFQKDSLILLASASNSSNWRKCLDIVINTKIKSSILVMIGDMTNSMREKMHSTFNELSKNSLFYWVYINPLHDEKTSSAIWNQVITLTHYKNAAVAELQFDPNGHMIEEYNLQGLHLFSITTTFPPYTNMPEICRKCKKMTKCPDCTISGLIVDILNNLGHEMNFTWESHEDPDNKVGSSPVSGPANASGAWEGTLGQVFYGDYLMSADAWNEKLERSDMFDFVSFVSDRTILALTPQSANLDLWLFTRPFRNEVWIVIFLSTVIILAFVIGPYYKNREVFKLQGHRMVCSIGWLFFLLLSVYYDGALTMFFSTEVSISFNSIRDVIRAYDNWKLMMMEGNEVHFVYYVQDGDPDYTEFWDRKLNKPEETVFSAPKQGISRMQNDRVVLHLQESTLKGHLLEHPEAGYNIKVFGGSKPEYFNIMLNNNSPLGPMLRFGCLRLSEFGVMDHVQMKWLGKDIGSSGTSSASLDQTLMLLTPRQLVMIFFVLLCLLFTCFVILCIEMLMGNRHSNIS